MSWKKNMQTKKYKPKSEFRRNKSHSGTWHPNYVFGETEKNYKSLSITHSPDEKYKNVKLKKNPNPKDTEDAYLEIKPKTTHKHYFSEPLDDYKFDKADMPLVRHCIKTYKKSAYSHKKRK